MRFFVRKKHEIPLLNLDISFIFFTFISYYLYGGFWRKIRLESNLWWWYYHKNNVDNYTLVQSICHIALTKMNVPFWLSRQLNIRSNIVINNVLMLRPADFFPSHNHRFSFVSHLGISLLYQALMSEKQFPDSK